MNKPPKTEHTPLPWKVGGADNNDKRTIYSESSAVECYTNGKLDEEAKRPPKIVAEIPAVLYRMNRARDSEGPWNWQESHDHMERDANANLIVTAVNSYHKDQETIKEYEETMRKQHAIINKLLDALLWCSGSGDFNEGGQARKGWLKLCQPIIDEFRTKHQQQGGDDE